MTPDLGDVLTLLARSPADLSLSVSGAGTVKGEETLLGPTDMRAADLRFGGEMRLQRLTLVSEAPEKTHQSSGEAVSALCRIRNEQFTNKFEPQNCLMLKC